MFEGVLPALITPFNEDESIDFKSLSGLIEFLLEAGIHGIVTCGTTGESACLTREERIEFNTHVVTQIKKRIPVIAGVGSNSTAATIQLAQDAEKTGADGLLVITPYYNKPTPEGLYRHFINVAEKSSLPIVLYNVPSRTGINMDAETIEKLSDHPGFVALKEASGSLDQVTAFINICGDRMNILSGDDILTLPILAIGGKGVISVTANILPGKLVQQFQSFKTNDLKTAQAINEEMFPIHKAMFIETNPIPVKTALSMMGMIKPVFRLPLVPMKEKNLVSLRQVLTKYGVL
jgi:4-hydroxy-tetrahydrodipicolinate synthase